MTWNSKNDLPEFNVLDFEVHAVYGAHFNIPIGKEDGWAEWFETQKRSSESTSPIRESWTPIYRDHCSTVTVKIDSPLCCSEIEVHHPEFFSRGKPSKSIDPSPITMSVSRFLTIREDGVAAITIRLESNKRVVPFTLADVLAPLFLAPRIINGIKLRPKGRKVNAREEWASARPEIYAATVNADTDSPEALLDGLATSDKTVLFQIFLGTLKAIVSAIPLDWREYRAASNAIEQTGALQHVPEILPWVGDQQVPYFVVLATLPGLIYKMAFLEEGVKVQKKKMIARRQYTRSLAAIMQRWLSPHNARFVSIDYLESLNLLRDGAFVNKYTNSLSFITYTSTGTLCLRPELESGYSHGELDPQEATYGSILHCVELSRLRWHHALRLNRQLDELTARVIRHNVTSGFDVFLAELMNIRAEAALHLLDPLTYQWDAAVGSDIAEFLQGSVIERIENECIKKLEMVKELIHERLDLFRARAMRRELRPK